MRQIPSLLLFTLLTAIACPALASTIHVSGAFSGTNFAPQAGSLTPPLANLSGSFAGSFDDTGLGSSYTIEFAPTSAAVNGIGSLDETNTLIRFQVSGSSVSVTFGGTVNASSGILAGSDDVVATYTGDLSGGNLTYLVYTLASTPPDGISSAHGRFASVPPSATGSFTVPEPATALLLMGSLLALARQRRE